MIFFVYIDWTLEVFPRAFYVGKGLMVRVKKPERNEHWRNIAIKYGWRREVILATKEEAYAFEQEILGILELGTFENEKFGRWGANKTAGGEGVTGYRHTIEHLESIKGENHPMFGKTHAATTLAKLSGSNNHMYGRKGPAHPRYGIIHTQASIGKMRSNATLTWENVLDIRAKFATGKFTCKELANIHNMDYKAIWKVIHHKTWKTVLDRQVA